MLRKLYCINKSYSHPMMLVSVTYLHYVYQRLFNLVEHFEKHLLLESKLNIKIHSSNPNFCIHLLLLTFSHSLIIMYLLVLKLAKLEYPSSTVNQLKMREWKQVSHLQYCPNLVKNIMQISGKYNCYDMFPKQDSTK